MSAHKKEKSRILIAGLVLANILLTFSLFIIHTGPTWLMTVLQCGLLLILYRTGFPDFIRGLFWPLFSAGLLFLPWPWASIAPIVVYLAVILPWKKARKELAWLRFGKMDKTVVLWMIPVILVSSAALILWLFLCKPDLSDLKAMVPITSVPLLVLAGLVFSVFNAAWEEIILKGILWDGLEKTIGSVFFIVIFQAVLFGMMHLNGFPRGIIGAVLAGIYGLLIGFIRKYSGGLLAPVVTHFFADATIFALLVISRLQA